GLGPHDVRAKPPALGAQCERDLPRDPDEILRLHPRGDATGTSWHWRAAPAIRDLVAARGGVAVAEDEPECPVRSEHAADLAEHREEVLDVELGCGLQAEAALPCLTA